MGFMKALNPLLSYTFDGTIEPVQYNQMEEAQATNVMRRYRELYHELHGDDTPLVVGDEAVLKKLISNPTEWDDWSDHQHGMIGGEKVIAKLSSEKLMKMAEDYPKSHATNPKPIPIVPR